MRNKPTKLEIAKTAFLFFALMNFIILFIVFAAYLLNVNPY